MVVRHDGHHRRPYDIEDGQVMGLIEFVKPGPFRLAQRFQHGSGIRNRARDDVAHMPVRFVVRERGPAIGGELIEIEHHSPSFDNKSSMANLPAVNAQACHFPARYCFAATRSGRPPSAWAASATSFS